MEDFKQFQGKDVDEAIDKACEYFGAERDQLEVEITSGGSSGIFGLVGVKKAEINARKKNDLKELEADIREIITRLTRDMTPDPKLRIEIESDPIQVVLEDEENSGLLIGRDGQTITALQYIANRIIARKWPGAARLQLDSGDFRNKQQEKLKSTAQHLADKAKQAGRVMSTQPLSAFHRRVVHMALQEDKAVSTRSKGDGPLKRVLIMPRKKKNKQEKETVEQQA
jgi:spoIIIJ-associated protein